MNLNSIPSKLSGRLFLSAISIALMGGWFLGVTGIWYSYSNTDGDAAITVQDIRWHFNGNPNANRFASMSQGEMREHFTDEADVDLFVNWSREAASKEFDSTLHIAKFQKEIKPIMEWDCLECHEPGGKAEESPMRNYEEVLPYLARDNGPSWQSLAKFSHFHLLGIGTVILLSGLLAFLYLKPREAGILSSLASIGLLCDVGGWWLTKALAWPAPLIMIGGALIAAGLCLTHIALLRHYWRKQNNID